MDWIKNKLGLHTQNGLQIQGSNSDEIFSQQSQDISVPNPSNDTEVEKPKGWELISINKSVLSLFTPVEEMKSESEDQSVNHQAKPDELKNESKDLKEGIVQSPVKNCLSCKVIGAGTLSTAVAFLLHNGKLNQNNYKGFKKFAFISQYLLLSTTLALLAVCVVFDLGPLQDKQKGENMLDMAKDDLSYFKKKMSELSSSKSTK